MERKRLKRSTFNPMVLKETADKFEISAQYVRKHLKGEVFTGQTEAIVKHYRGLEHHISVAVTDFRLTN